jgi:hypothetical protein
MTPQLIKQINHIHCLFAEEYWVNKMLPLQIIRTKSSENSIVFDLLNY